MTILFETKLLWNTVIDMEELLPPINLTSTYDTYSGSMSLSWESKSLVETGQLVYRNLQPTAIENLDVPYAFVDSGITEYVDEYVVEGQVYYYRAGSTDGNRQVISDELRAKTVLVPPFDISGDAVEIAPVAPTVIGEAFGGGYYIGNITVPSGENAGPYAIIMAGASSEVNVAWKTTPSDTTGTNSTFDGMANTLAMEAVGISLHPAGKHCLDYAGGGYTDWYLPARNELTLAWTNRAQLSGLAMVGQFYWSSTQSPSTHAQCVNFNSGGIVSSSKSNGYRVRPVRRIKLTT